uniref:NADH-ubiquinone oxidoreductase chain 6 n=1 Tax=Schimmelmannia schousboei TaxID=173468 RepID=A0A0E3DBT1_9FLOR|nr:NADH dehydrogenase subunit 6 [Schimmelmannia schousboei]
MNIDIFLFYVFSSFALISALMVISSMNAVHSVLFLILVFCNIAGLLVLLGAEFLSFMLLIVYVGAIAVLFLFVVMMLNIKIVKVETNVFTVIPIGIIIFIIFWNQFYSAIQDFDLLKLQEKEIIWTSWLTESNNIINIKVVGNILYTHYSLLFLLSGLILLVAMIGAIVLTMHQRTDVMKQQISSQLARNPKGSIKFVTLRK